MLFRSHNLPRKGKAGLFDVGNELENVAFYGGDYGIYTTKASPGWPVMMVDSYFEGQRVAALRCQESGLAMVNLYAKNVPAVFDIDPNYCDKLFLENSYFENVSGPAVVITNENNSNVFQLIAHIEQTSLAFTYVYGHITDKTVLGKVCA